MFGCLYNFNFLHDLLHTCNVLNTQLNNDNYLEAKETLEHLTNKTYKEFNAIYSNSIILNYVIVKLSISTLHV